MSIECKKSTVSEQVTFPKFDYNEIPSHNQKRLEDFFSTLECGNNIPDVLVLPVGGSEAFGYIGKILMLIKEKKKLPDAIIGGSGGAMVGALFSLWIKKHNDILTKFINDKIEVTEVIESILSYCPQVDNSDDLFLNNELFIEEFENSIIRLSGNDNAEKVNLSEGKIPLLVITSTIHGKDVYFTGGDPLLRTVLTSSSYKPIQLDTKETLPVASLGGVLANQLKKMISETALLTDGEINIFGNISLFDAAHSNPLGLDLLDGKKVNANVIYSLVPGDLSEVETVNTSSTSVYPLYKQKYSQNIDQVSLMKNFDRSSVLAKVLIGYYGYDKSLEFYQDKVHKISLYSTTPNKVSWFDENIRGLKPDDESLGKLSSLQLDYDMSEKTLEYLKIILDSNKNLASLKGETKVDSNG